MVTVDAPIPTSETSEKGSALVLVGIYMFDCSDVFAGTASTSETFENWNVYNS